jgi:hypothetical protein
LKAENIMDELKREIESLAGETIALQSLLFWIIFHVTREHENPIAKAIDSAADMVESETIKHGKAASPAHLAKALQIVEHFREALPPKPRKPSPPE